MPPVANPNPDRARRGAAVENPEPVIEELLPVRAAAQPIAQPQNAFRLMAVRTTGLQQTQTAGGKRPAPVQRT